MVDGWARYGVTSATSATSAAVAYASARPQLAVVEGRFVGGLLTARLAGPSAGAAWLIRRITVSTPGHLGTGVRAYVYVGEVAPETLVMGTRSGQLDTAVEDPPIYVPDSTPLVIQWAEGPTRALARVEYQET